MSILLLTLAVAPAVACADLSRAAAGRLPDASSVITSAAVVPAGPLAGAGAPRVLPEHCEVSGHLRERTGVDGKRYAIRFHMRLPSAWNGRFVFQGSGGTAGDVGDATGPVNPSVPTAIERGFAVLSEDTGHDNRTNSDPARQGAAAFAHDPQARRDYADASLEATARLAQALIAVFYGRAAERSYFVGCSNGGREGMVFAQRHPELFDGIVAAAPGFALPKAAVAEVWDTQAFATAARSMGLVDSAGLPRVNRAMSDADLALAARAVLDACDALDGAADGLVGDHRACTTALVAPKLAERTCAGAKTDACLTKEQVAALRRVIAGPTNGRGEALYSDWAWDPGLGDMGWRVWKLGGYDGRPFPYPINVVLGGPSMSALFTTPPVVVPNVPPALLAYQLGFDFDRDAPKIFATSGAFTESSWDLVAARSTDLSAFRRRGGKMIVPHGMADPVFSAHDTMRWWDAVNAASGGRAADFVRVFPVPGMTHCGGGPSTDRYDCLAALVDWVEKGVAPDRITASAGPGSPWPGRTRPLCPYPSVARYRGAGSADSAASFTCR